MEQRKVVTVGLFSVAATSLQVGAGRVWVWPEGAIGKIQKKWEERRQAALDPGAFQYLKGRKNNDAQKN